MTDQISKQVADRVIAHVSRQRESKSAGQTPNAPQEEPAPPAAEPPVEPPFPRRPNPFALPGSGRSAEPADAGSAPAASSRVELKGFARVGRLRAILLIDGEIASLAVGQRRGRVEVVAIDPPQVTLRRGEDTWDARLTRLAEKQSQRATP